MTNVLFFRPCDETHPGHRSAGRRRHRQADVRLPAQVRPLRARVHELQPGGLGEGHPRQPPHRLPATRVPLRVHHRLSHQGNRRKGELLQKKIPNDRIPNALRAQKTSVLSH